MSSEIKVEIIDEKTIKPSSPTPSHLTSSKFSFFDQLAPDVYDQIVLFYPSSSTHGGDYDHLTSLAKRSQVLTTSLSEALTHFYVFAGEFKYNVAISCNDQGALFVEARVINCPISKILDRPGLGLQYKLLPNGMEYRTQSGTRYVLLVQANFFECGGLAIGVSLSHKVADASTLGKFISSWAVIALGSSTATADIGTAASRFPPLDFLNSPDAQLSMHFFKGHDVVTRRFVFDAPMIAALKSKAASSAVPNPTRVEVVSALIWKCAVETSRSNTSLLRPSAYNQAVNIRRILLPPLGQDVVGNLFSSFTAKTEEADDLQSLVAKLRAGLEKFKLRYANGVTGEEFIQLSREFQEGVVKDDKDIYYSSSWCGFPFYSANFGWGRPTWVTLLVDAPIKNMTVLVDVSDGIGIEAHVTLKPEDMALFQRNQELLAFASYTY